MGNAEYQDRQTRIQPRFSKMEDRKSDDKGKSDIPHRQTGGHDGHEFLTLILAEITRPKRELCPSPLLETATRLNVHPPM